MLGHAWAVFIELYIHALLSDEELADGVWAVWNAGLIDDRLAALCWWLISAPIDHETLASEGCADH